MEGIVIVYGADGKIRKSVRMTFEVGSNKVGSIVYVNFL